MREAIRGVDVVVSAVGARDVSQPTTVVTDTARTRVEAMRVAEEPRFHQVRVGLSY